MNKLIAGALFTLMPLVSNAEHLLAPMASPKNIIMVVADGMGPAYTTAYRLYNDNPDTPAIEETVFDRHFIGSASTYPAPVSGYVTDSAAAATALATGIKTYNGAIGLDVDKKPVLTVLEYAKQQGKKTGLVVTSQVNHATPASYIAHNESRHNYNAIADTYLDANKQLKADIILGGGWHYFIREDRNIVNEFQAADGHYVDQPAQLSNLPKNKSVLGLFADKGLPAALDDDNPHRLSTMTKAALEHLENPNGYFMLIEASQVDWAGHGNDISAAMAEMKDLAKTIELLEQYVKQNPDTLVMLTADHSTGGFTIGADGKYAWQPEVLRKQSHSPYFIAAQLEKATITAELAKKLLKVELTDVELSQLKSAKQKAKQALKEYMALTKPKQAQAKKPNIAYSLSSSIKKLIDKRTNSGWTTNGHTGVDVPVYALGSNKQAFAGKIDNTDIANKIFKLLKN